MSRIYDHFKSPEARIEQENGEREPSGQRVAHEEQLSLVTAERGGQVRQLRAEELAIQARLHEAAIERTHKRTAEEERLAEEYVVQLAQEARLKVFARERAQAEQAERAALATRIEAERQLADQLVARFEQEKIERAQAAQRAAHEEQLRLVLAEREEQERLLQAEELAAQAHLHEAAIGEARLRAVEEVRRAEEYAARLAEEARLEALVRERTQTEQAEQAALAARIEAERRLAAQIEARIEQEKLERAQASRRVAHEEKLRMATAGREAQERQLRIEELAAQACSHEVAIEEARKRAAEETRRTEEHAALLAQEALLEALARERAQIEQTERAALAARIEAERQLAVQLEARIEQEKLEREQSVLRAAHEERLRLVTAEREAQERRRQAEERAAEITVGVIVVPARLMEGRATECVAFIRPSILDPDRRYPGYLAMVLLVVGAGFFMAAGPRFFDNRSGAAPVQSGDNAASVSVTANSPAPGMQAVIDQAGLAARPQQRAEAEIRQTVLQWAEAWSRRDAAAYLSFYAAEFNLPEGMQRSDWEVQRQSRLRKYRSIEVTLKDMKISYPGGDAASVRFAMDFRADSYREMGTKKELRLRNSQGRWLIVGEKNS